MADPRSWIKSPERAAMFSPEIEFSASPAAPGLLASLGEHYRLWRERRRWIGEMTNAAALGRIDDVLGDVGVSRAELDTLLEEPADAGRQFETLAEMADIDLHH